LFPLSISSKKSPVFLRSKTSEANPYASLLNNIFFVYLCLNWRHKGTAETFAGTANVDFRLPFADQGKQTFVFHLQKTNGNLPFPLVPFSVYIYIDTAAYV
jgi:hypothetical protein